MGKELANVSTDGEAINLSFQGINAKVEAWGRDGIRVRASMLSEIRDDTPNALLDKRDSKPEISSNSDTVSLMSGGLEARIDFTQDPVSLCPWRISFMDVDSGSELISEDPQRFIRWPRTYFKPLPGGSFRIEARFRSYSGERIYGLGQHQHGLLDQKGAVIDLVQRNTEVSIPFLYSSRGYGFLWNNPGVGRVELGESGTRWIAESSRQLDYWVTSGKRPSEVMERYSEVTGKPPMMPDWGTGFWQCKLRYQTQDELLSVAREYIRRGLPLSVIVVDFFHWTLMGDWKFDPVEWPDPSGMVRELEEMGVKLMVSIWPTVNPLSENFGEMERKGYLISTASGIPAHTIFADKRPDGPLQLYYYDSTNPDARKFVWDKVRTNYLSHGVKAWWLDACEPEIYPLDHENMKLHAGYGPDVANIYPLLHARGFHEGMKSAGEAEVLSLCRSAWAGSQRYGSAVWSGDIASSFEALRAQVRAGLNMAMSGIPWWTTDIGGFHGGDPELPSFRELLIRWFQYGVFCPIFRLHGHRSPAVGFTGGPNEAWSFGEDAHEIISGLIRMRERMRPYISEHMKLASERGWPVMRPLFFDFPGDEESWCVGDEFMFGPDVLVAPVLHEGAREREVYFPSNEWIDAYTGDRVAGGQSIRVDAPLKRIPFYYREGAGQDFGRL